ncbi:MAG: RDD family protein [Acidobacteriota bacterium]|nr:RDD family protein [Acidobacteriota bacterium]
MVVDPVLHQPLAPWWKRLLAILIDGAILGVGYGIVLVGLALANANETTTPSTPNAPAGSVIAGLVFFWLVMSVPAAIYYGAMNGSRRGQTVGKMALNIAVRDANYGSPIGFGRAFGRYLLTVLFTLLLYIPAILDYLWPLWDERRQSWHDKAVRSVVVDLRP